MLLNLYKAWIINLPFRLLSRKSFLGEIKLIDIQLIYTRKTFIYIKLLLEESRPMILVKYSKLKFKEYLKK
jgi:hypothetical protein